MLVKAQGMPVAVLTCDSFANFSSCHAAPLPLVCHLPPRCWGVKVEWRGKDDVRFCIAMDKVCKAEMIWLQCWKCGDHRQLSNSHSLYFFLLYRNGQLCLPHGLHLLFPCECLPISQSYSAPDQCPDPGWLLLWHSIGWNFWGRTLVARTIFTEALSRH